MAIKFQYNKVSLQEMEKQLKVRTEALPVLKFKEAILRAENNKIKKKAGEIEKRIAGKMKDYEYMDFLWQEFPPNVIIVKNVKSVAKNIAGVNVPHFENAEYDAGSLYLFHYPFWILDGMEILKEFISLSFEMQMLSTASTLLESARKKATQKVNLYEKVQIPGFEDAISKIKKFLNDEDSLDKAVQKIMKKKVVSV